MINKANYNLLGHNTFGINATCKHFCEFSSENELQEALSKYKEEKLLVIGEGSNLLFTNDFEGCVLHSSIKGKELVYEDDEKVVLKVGSGENWDSLVDYCVRKGYYGAENLSLIPGEVGASAVQNIGAYGMEAKDLIVAVQTIEISTGKSISFTKDDCCYAYRQSIFKGALKDKYVITYVLYSFSKTFIPNIQYAALQRELDERCLTKYDAQTLRNIIIEIRQNKLPDPKEIGSAGSFFMNPIVPREKYNDLMAEFRNVPHYEMENGIKIPAGWLIEKCGWKGKSLGAAGVYEKQALVLVNRGGATGQDIVNLSNTIQADVYKKFRIKIYPEVIWI